jgi:hypothetical protein
MIRVSHMDPIGLIRSHMYIQPQMRDLRFDHERLSHNMKRLREALTCVNTHSNSCFIIHLLDDLAQLSES